MSGLLMLVLLIGSAVSGVPLGNQLETNDLPSETDFLKGIDKCAFKSDNEDIASCATERIVRSLDKLSAQQNLEIIPGVSLLSDSSSSNYRSGKELKDEIEQAKVSDGSMLELIGEATTRLFAGRTLKVKLPDSETIGRAIEEGRKKSGGGNNKKKGNDMMKNLMSIGGVLAAMVPIFLGKVALIATKALIVGKIALIIGGILLFQMFMKQNNNHGIDSSWSVAPQVSYSPPSNSYGSPVSSYGPPATSYGVPSGPYSRSLDVAAQEMAYSAQK